MSKRTKPSRKSIWIYLAFTQIMGVMGAVMIGGVLDAGLPGYIGGYVVGVALSLGCTFGLP